MTEPGAEERLNNLRERKRKTSLTPSEMNLLDRMEAEKVELEDQATRIQASFRAKQGRKTATKKRQYKEKAAAIKIQSLRRQQQARRQMRQLVESKRRSFRSVTGLTVAFSYEPELYFADRFDKSGESLPLLPKLKLVKGDCVDVIDRQGNMVWGRMGDSLGWFPAACVGLGPVATYSKDANRLPPELSLETKTLAQIRRDFARKKEREARAAAAAREEEERKEAEKAARAQAERAKDAERSARLFGGASDGPPQLMAFFVDQRTALAAIRQERVNMRARRGAALVYRKPVWRAPGPGSAPSLLG